MFLISQIINVQAKTNAKHLDGLFAGPIITGTQATSPFIAAGTNVIAAISNGAGILQVPSYSSGIIFGSKGAGVPGWAADGAGATFSTAHSKGEWVQFAISPTPGADLSITGFNIWGTTTSASTKNFYAIAYATDTAAFGTATCTFLDTAGVIGSNPSITNASLIGSTFNTGQNISVLNGSMLYIRVYLWRTNNAASSAQFTITDFKIDGSSTSNSTGTPTTSTTNASICFGSSYLFNGMSYTTSGTYVAHLTNASGADSAATLNLSVSPAATLNVINLTGCPSVTYKNVTYTSSVTVVDTVKNIAGCDSIYNLAYITVSCLPSITSFTPMLGRTGDTITIHGLNFTGTSAVTFGDTAAHHFMVVNDSTITAVVGNGASGSVNVTTSYGSFPLPGFMFKNTNTTGYIVAGVQATTPFITAGTNVVDSISNGIGILQLPAYTTGIIFGTKGAGIPGWAADGPAATFATAHAKGEWVQFDIAPKAGYDLNITGFDIKGNTTSASANNFYAIAYANADTAAFGNATCTFLDTAGITGNNPTITSASLISSTFNMGQNITVLNGTKLSVRVYMWRRNNATSSAQFSITDFTVTGTSKVSSGAMPSSSTTNASICFGSSYLFNGMSYTTSGTYVAHLTNAAGADSAAKLILVVSPAASLNIVNLTGCPSVTYKNVTYTSSINLTDTVKSIAGCDSIYNLTYITITCMPSITSFAPHIGKTGDTVLIKGINFTTTTAVTFGDSAAHHFMVVNDSTIMAFVGNGASGSVNVVTTYGSFPLPGFMYKPTNSKGFIVTGLQSTTPFIAAGTNVTTSLLTGSGILQLPKDTITGIIFGTKGAGIPGWAADGPGANFATANAKGEWVQFAIAPTAGNDLHIAGFDIRGNGATSSTANFIAVAYASDTAAFTAATCTFLDSTGITGLNPSINIGTSLIATSFNTGQNVTVLNGDSIYVRIYMWRRNNATSSSQFTLTDFTIKGIATNANGTPSYSSTSAKTCYGNPYAFNGSTFYTSGTYITHLANAVGADSAATLILTVSAAPVTNPTTFTSCNSVNFNSHEYFSSAVLSDTIKNSFGCDSIYNVVTITITPTISGSVLTPNGKTITKVAAGLKNGTPNSTTVVGGIGSYAFACLTPGFSDTVKLTKNNDSIKANGVTTLDIALIQSNILGKSLLNSPYKLIAADVNGDGKVTTLDIVFIKRLILGLDTTFNKTSTGEKRLWAFVDSSFTFTTPSNPFPYKDSITHNTLASSQYNQSFIGCKLGDVNWDWNPAIAKPAISTINAVELNYEVTKTGNDNLIRIPVKVSNFKEMIGMQFTINFDADKMAWKGMAHNVLNLDMGTNHANEGKLTFLWNDPTAEMKTMEDGSVMMELLFEPTSFNTINPVISLDGSVTAVAAYDKDYIQHNVVLNAAKVNMADAQDRWVVSPNPASKGVIKVQMHLNENKSVVFKLMDNTGKVLLEQKKDCVGGNNSIVLLENNRLPAGVYHLLANGVGGEKVKTLIIQ